MSNTDDININISNSSNKIEIHYLPCSIDYNGSAPICSYFHQTEATDKSHKLSQFRGRELKGIDINLNSYNIKGLCVSKDSSNPNNIHVIDKFDQMTVWQHDTLPSDHQFLDSMKWFDIAKAVSAILIYVY